MPWNQQGDGGGSWGGGQGPWGNRGQPGGNGKGSGGRDDGGDKSPRRGPGGQMPPDLDAFLQRLRMRWRRGFPNGTGGGTVISGIVLVVLVLWLATGIYRVQPDEQGVVLRFGAYQETTQSGLHYHLPQPIETVLKPTVTRVRRTDIGFGVDNEGSGMQLPEEALMLTGDENIVDINLSVFWTVKDARAYLFNIRSPDATVKSASESAVREIIGQNPIAPVLAEGRATIEGDTQKLLQSILDSYGAGILITQVQLQKADPPQPVIEAFRDVQRARTDMERLRNEAESYSNDVVPRARGDALRLTQEAEAYRSEVVARSQGDAQRFLQVYKAWANAKDVTSERLYLETMEEVFEEFQ